MRPSLSQWVNTIAALALVGAFGCRRELTGRAGLDAKVAEYVPMIEKSLGRKFKSPPRLEIRTRDQVRTFLLRMVEDSIPKRELAGETATFHVLGLIPDTLDLVKFYVPLLTEQILGFYDPKTKVLYVVDGAPVDYRNFTIMHELVHALQDQYVNLDSIQDQTGDADRQGAAQAVIEGQATYEQAILMTGGPGNLVAALPGGSEQIRAMIRDAQTTQPVFANAPMVIQESLLFPYVNGWEFVKRYATRHPSTMPFDSLPQSTEQVLHESAYFGKRPDPPIVVTLPTVTGSIYENDLGEFGTRLFLFNYLKDTKVAASAAAGWGGDRYAVVRTSRGNGIVWVSAWDTPLDAAEYVSAMTTVINKRYADSGQVVTPNTDKSGARRYTIGGRTIVLATGEIGGRRVVSYTDVPAGANAALVDLAKVKLH